MTIQRKLITAAELDEMTPDERAQVVAEGIVTDIDELPPAFRRRVEETGSRLAASHDAKPTN